MPKDIKYVIDALFHCKPRIMVPRLGISGDELINRLKAESPAVFHVESYNCMCDPLGYPVLLMPQYTYTEEEYRATREAISRKTKPLKTRLLQCKNDYERVLMVHDYICTNMHYEDCGPKAHTLVSPILEGRGVCDGITQAAQFLLKGCGIKSYEQSGMAPSTVGGEPGPHAWSVIQLDGKWYYADMTFDMCGSSDGHIRYCYFLLSAKELFRRHTIGTPVMVDPNEIVHTDDYYARAGLTIRDPDALYRYFVDVFRRRETFIQFRYLRPLQELEDVMVRAATDVRVGFSRTSSPDRYRRVYIAEFRYY